MKSILLTALAVVALLGAVVLAVKSVPGSQGATVAHLVGSEADDGRPSGPGPTAPIGSAL